MAGKYKTKDGRESKIPPEIQGDNKAIGTWLASQPVEVQQDILGTSNPKINKTTGSKGGEDWNAVVDALYTERARLFREDPSHPPPGVNAEGEGIPGEYLGGGAKARSVQAAGQERVNEVADAYGDLTVDDYTVNPTLDEGAGYDLVDRVHLLGDALPLDQQLQLDAILQRRSDTTGVDAQKASLEQLSGILSGGGLTAIERARMAKSQALREAQGRAAEGAIRADAEEQGRAGGRMSMLLRNQAQQRATNQRAQDDLDTKALALGRYDSAIRAQADIGNTIQTTQDLIDKFNTEDYRAMRDKGNEAREKTWSENNRRDSVDAGTLNEAEGVDFAIKTARSDKNTDRINEGEYFNKGPSGGRRGLMREKLAAAEAAAGHGEVGAALIAGQERDAAAANAAKTNAIVTGATGALGFGGDVATAGLKELWDDD